MRPDNSSDTAEPASRRAANLAPSKDESFRSVAKEIMPQEEATYYKELEDKHFSKDAVGSVFQEKSLQDLLEKNPQLLNEKGNREDFLSLGVSESALLPGREYFLLRAEGEEGMVPAENLSPNTPVHIKRAKGDFLSFTTPGQRRQTNWATAIIGQYPKDPSRRALITVFPGLPAEPERSGIKKENRLGLRDGQTLPLGELEERTGRDDLLLQVF